MPEYRVFTEEQFDKMVQRLMNILFEGNEENFVKVLWRMSCGSRARALEIAQGAIHHYKGFQDISPADFSDMFDHACANITGGCEVEWKTLEYYTEEQKERDDRRKK